MCSVQSKRISYGSWDENRVSMYFKNADNTDINAQSVVSCVHICRYMWIISINGTIFWKDLKENHIRGNSRWKKICK